MTSLDAVSKKAGVSLATASRVLNGSTHPVSENMRQKVLQAADELGYSPSALAQALVNRTSRILGVIVEDNTDPYFAEITRGVEEAGNRAGYLTMVCNAERNVDIEVAQLQMLYHHRVAGVIFAGAGFAGRDDAGLADLAARAQADGITIVALARRDIEAQVVTYDNHAIAYDLTQYVISLGHRRIVLVEGLPDVYTSVERREGYQDAMRQADLEPELVGGGFDPDSGSAAALRMLATGSLPDAIIGSNDLTAIGVMTALRRASIGVPAEVSVAGIGGTNFARLLDLTTAAAPLHTLGALAAQRILGGTSADAGPTLLPHRVVALGTTAPRGIADGRARGARR